MIIHSDDHYIYSYRSYVASECKFNVTRSLKLTGDKDNLHQMSVLVDMKRRSPTIPHQRNIVEFESAAKFAELLTLANTDAFLINTDELEYGGKYTDLKECAIATKKTRFSRPPAIIQKDIIIHPIQIAMALDQGASGVLLIVAVVGGDLEVLLDACTIMGTEALVEVHTPNELEFALNKVLTHLLMHLYLYPHSLIFAQ